MGTFSNSHCDGCRRLFKEELTPGEADTWWCAGCVADGRASAWRPSTPIGRELAAIARAKMPVGTVVSGPAPDGTVTVHLATSAKQRAELSPQWDELVFRARSLKLSTYAEQDRAVLEALTRKPPGWTWTGPMWWRATTQRARHAALVRATVSVLAIFAAAALSIAAVAVAL